MSTSRMSGEENLLLKKKAKLPVTVTASSIKVSSESSLWQYNFIYLMSVLMIISGTFLWRVWGLSVCGSFCELNALKESSYFNYAGMTNVYDYTNFPGLQYPAGIVYFYKGLNWIFENIPADKAELFKQALPIGIFCYFLFLVNVLMKRCRIPATFLVFFVFPGAALLQGHSLMFVLPEMLGLVWFLQALTALIGGYHKLSVICLGMGLLFDFVIVFPVLPAFSLCLMRSMGARWTLLWMGVVLLSSFSIISSQFLLNNPTEYLTKALGLQIRISTWNPLIWLLHWSEDQLNLKVLTRDRLEGILQSLWTGIILQFSSQLFLANFRWLRADGGIFGLFSKFIKSNRGHGIRPNPWTPRQTLTVIFESFLLSVILRFPSLIHVQEFELISVLLSGFFCVGLSDKIPVPGYYGIFAALTFPLTFLYRSLELENENLSNTTVNNIHFHLGFKESLHFLPMLLLPIVQLIILFGLKRRDVILSFSQNQNHSSSNGFVPTHHRRSSSLSRRKVD